MNFEQDYNVIKNSVQEDLIFLETEIKNLFQGENPLDKDISAFLTTSAKRLRPLLGFLFLRSIFGEINNAQKNILLAVELIHNATLIHDDIIDKAEKRRDKKTFNAKFDNNLAVIAGDFLLSISMEKVISTNSIEVLQVFASALKSTCLGEINQYFSKFGITTIDEYIEKSKKKTALLFQIALLGGVILSEKPIDDNLKQMAIDFSQNFGIAFQIRDDLRNVLNATNISNNDIDSGIYTAPVIFAYQENPNILKERNILNAIKNTKGIEKTKNLMDNYFDKAIETIGELRNNTYKHTLLDLIELLRVN